MSTAGISYADPRRRDLAIHHIEERRDCHHPSGGHDVPTRVDHSGRDSQQCSDGRNGVRIDVVPCE